MWDDSKILFGLHHMPGIGWKSIARIVMKLGGHMEKLLHAQNELAEMKGQHLVKEDVERRWQTYVDKGITVITYYCETYPPLLREAMQPPWVLYCIGNMALLGKNKLAIVGTRTPTSYGQRIAERFARELSERDWCIVSGLARGIDSTAHQGALQGRGSTIAVLGAGIDVVYPPEHRPLYDTIAEKGLLISEFPLQTRPKPGLFPLRNRIIAGLSRGTLVVEAAKRSGSLITAMQAIEQNREVFAIPGPIYSPKSAGVNELIQKSEAMLVTSVDEMVSELQAGAIEPLPGAAHMTQRAVHQMSNLSEDEQKVWHLLIQEPLHFDELLQQTQFSFGHLHSVLLSLCLKSLIAQNFGGTYVAIIK